MSLAGALVSVVCLGTSPQYSPACKAAMEAEVKQTGYEQKFNNFEGTYSKRLETSVRNAMGNDNFNATGATLFVANTVREKAVSVGLPTAGLCNEFSAKVNTQSSKLVLKWNF